MSQVVRFKFPDVATVTELGPCWLGASGSESASWRPLGRVTPVPRRRRGHSIKYPGIFEKELFDIM